MVKAIALSHHRLVVAIPGIVVAKENAGDADARQVFVAGVAIMHQVIRCDFRLTDQVSDAKAQQAEDFFQPAPVQDVFGGGGCRPAIFMLRVIAPHDQWHIELHGYAPRNGENSDVFWPGHIADGGQCQLVDVTADDGFGRHINEINA